MLLVIIIVVPTIQKMGLYLEKVKDWEVFGYQLLPENKEHLVEVHVLNKSCFECNLIAIYHCVHTVNGKKIRWAKLSRIPLNVVFHEKALYKACMKQINIHRKTFIVLLKTAKNVEV